MNNENQSVKDVESFSDLKFFDNRIIGNDWLTTEQAANLLSITSNALRIMVYRNQIPVYRVRTRLRFKLNDCLALFKKRENNGY